MAKGQEKASIHGQDDGMYLKRLVRYIHLNPLEALVVKHPEKFQWSSHRAYIGAAEYVWLTTDLVLSRFATNRKDAIHNFIEFMRPQPEIEIDAKNIIKAFSQGLYGSEEFIKETAPLYEIIPDQVAKKVLSLEDALTHICHKFQVDLKDLSSPHKHKNIVDARSILGLLGRIGQQKWNLQDVAILLKKNHGSISRLASRAKADPVLISYAETLISNQT
jgi:hypothetical protein